MAYYEGGCEAAESSGAEGGLEPPRYCYRQPSSLNLNDESTQSRPRSTGVGSPSSHSNEVCRGRPGPIGLGVNFRRGALAEWKR